MVNEKFNESLVKSVTLTPSDRLNGEAVVPGDKVASVHLLLATITVDDPTLVKNVHHCGDADRLISWAQKFELANISKLEGGELIVSPHVNRHTEIDLSELGDTRSNVCLVTAQTLKHGKVVFKGAGGCNFVERKIDRHLELMNAFGINVNAVSDKQIATVGTVPKTVGFDCATKKYGPSVGVTCHALIASLAYDRPITLVNCALEPAVTTILDFIKKRSDRTIIQNDRTIKLGAREKSARQDVLITIPPDLTVAFTLVCAVMAAGGQIVLKNVGTLPKFFAQALNQVSVEMGSRGNNLSVLVEKEKITHPRRVVCDVWPEFPSDIGPQLSAAIAGVTGTTTITDKIYDRRSAHVLGLNQMGYCLETNGNAVTINGNEPHAKEVGVEAPDIRSGAALLIGALGRQGLTTVTNYHQIYRGHATLINDLQTIGAKISLNL